MYAALHTWSGLSRVCDSSSRLLKSRASSFSAVSTILSTLHWAWWHRFISGVVNLSYKHKIESSKYPEPDKLQKCFLRHECDCTLQHLLNTLWTLDKKRHSDSRDRSGDEETKRSIWEQESFGARECRRWIWNQKLHRSGRRRIWEPECRFDVFQFSSGQPPTNAPIFSYDPNHEGDPNKKDPKFSGRDQRHIWMPYISCVKPGST